MKFSLNSTSATILVSLSGALLVACGGGGQADSGPVAPAATEPPTILASNTVVNNVAIAATVSESYAANLTASIVPTLPSTQPATATPIAAADLITDIRFDSTAAAGAAQSNIPVTFGQVFAPGHVLVTNSLVGKLPDGTTVPLQMDIKATHPDGSVRHAVLSAVLPHLSAGETRTVSIGRKPALSLIPVASPASLLSAGFTSKVNLTLNNEVYSASADELLKSSAYKTWLAGSIASEWIVSAPLKNAKGIAHPHLTARFAVRWYSAVKKARVDVTIENDWAYEAGPQNFTYDAQVMVGGNSVYQKAALTHFHHARWRKLFWWGDTPEVHVRHNTAYLIASRAVPNYDQSVVVAETVLSAMGSGWTGPKTEPMGIGAAEPYMPTTGGRGDIGLLPMWSAMYLLSMDKRAKDVMLGTADLAGSWSSHYRDKTTDLPVSLLNHPYMTILGHPGDTKNPVTGQYEAFPTCATTSSCASPYMHDTAHQPNFAYLPYLVTGDYYYLEELQFWAMYDVFSSNPGYRGNINGLLATDQVRGQGWSLRTLSEAAYITPDKDALKPALNGFVSNNLDWYNTNYSLNKNANALGVIIEHAFEYSNGTGIAPWQDDFFTAAVGHAAELGFAKAVPLLAFKAKFPIARMTASGTCWIDGAIYSMILRDSATDPIYTTMAQAYQANHTAQFNALACNSDAMASILKLGVGEMTGYASSATGFPSNMQPALAYSADAGGAAGSAAWAVFMNRSVKPNYGLEPQFAIVPR